MKGKQKSNYFVTKRTFSKNPFQGVSQNKIFYFTHYRRDFQKLSKKQQTQFIKDIKRFFGDDFIMMECWEKKLKIRL
jgi:hypothetical protein